jgi:hypothetical protein
LQDDLLYESLTVWEVLYYAAMLRLPRNMTTAAKKERVATVIKALGIDACRDTIFAAQIGKHCLLLHDRSISSSLASQNFLNCFKQLIYRRSLVSLSGT